MKVLIISILIILYCPNILNAEIDIKTTYQDTEGFYSYALIKYTNNTTKALKLVSIICIAHSTPTVKLSTSKTFYSLKQGYISARFTDTFILEFFLQGLPLKKIHCYCVNWE